MHKLFRWLRLERSVKPILTRYYVLRAKWLGIKIHHIKQSDPEFHTHPWWGISLHLRPYIEERMENGVVVTRKRWLINLVSPWLPHRVVTDRPLWTLFVHGKRVNENWQYGGTVAPWRGPDKPKQYKESTKALVAQAHQMVDEMKAKGMTKADFAAGLKRMLESPTGDDRENI